jgi:hypothetical protein
MTTETRGQSSTFIYAYGGKEFPVQKVMLLPEEVLDAMTFDLAAYVRASTEAQGVPERLTDGDTVWPWFGSYSPDDLYCCRIKSPGPVVRFIRRLPLPAAGPARLNHNLIHE